jgi:hypothetical protein
MTHYAINLADLLQFQREQPVIYGAWLLGTLTDKTVTIDHERFDAEALLFRDELVGDATCRLLHLKAPQLRTYKSDGKGWRRA